MYLRAVVVTEKFDIILNSFAPILVYPDHRKIANFICELKLITSHHKEATKSVKTLGPIAPY